MVGLEASEDDGGRGGPGDKDVGAFRDHADGSPGSNVYTNTVVAIHHTSLDLNLRERTQGGITGEESRCFLELHMGH